MTSAYHFLLLALIGLSQAISAGPCDGSLQSAFELKPPPEAEVIELQFEQPSVDPTMISKLRSAQAILKAAKQLSEAKVAQYPRTILYPYSSYDAATPRILFPDAETIVVWDMGPFVKSTSTKVTAQLSDIEMAGDFHTTGQSDDIASVADAVVMRLALTTKNFRLRKVTAIREDKKAWLMPNWDRQPVHGVIEYDSGPDTPIKRYIHINNMISEAVYQQQPWWHEQLLIHGFDVLILKAQTEGFKQMKKLERQLLTSLKYHNGFLLDGDGYPAQTRNTAIQMGAKAYKVPYFIGYSRGEILFFDEHDFDLRKMEKVEKP